MMGIPDTEDRISCNGAILIFIFIYFFYNYLKLASHFITLLAGQAERTARTVGT